jgi:uroporphyrinogen-III synthase
MSSSLPLAGRRILVTRPEAQAEALCDAISAAGGQPLRFPLLDIVAAPDAMLVDGTAVKIAAQGALVIFVSPNAVRHGLPHFLPWPAAARAAAIGAGTARALSDADIPDVILPADHTHFDSEGLLALPELAMKTIAGRKILIVRGNGGRELLQEILHTRGAAVIPLTAYRRTAPAPERLADLRKTLVTSPVDALTLSSSEMVASLAALFSGEGQLKVAENLCAYLQTRHCEARSAVAIQRAQSALAGALDCHGPEGPRNDEVGCSTLVFFYF